MQPGILSGGVDGSVQGVGVPSQPQQPNEFRRIVNDIAFGVNKTVGVLGSLIPGFPPNPAQVAAPAPPSAPNYAPVLAAAAAGVVVAAVVWRSRGA